MGSNKLNISPREIWGHFSLFIQDRSCWTYGFIPLSYLMIRSHEGQIEIESNNCDKKSKNVIFLASDVLFISTSGAFGVGVVLVGATKNYYCSGMIEYNTTDHFHLHFTVLNNFHLRYRRYQIEIFILKLRCFIHYALKLVFETQS